MAKYCIIIQNFACLQSLSLHLRLDNFILILNSKV